MLAAELLEKLKTFFDTGSNLYIVIAIAVAVLVLIVIVAVTAPKAKKKAKAKTEVPEDTVSDSGNASEEAETKPSVSPFDETPVDSAENVSEIKEKPEDEISAGKDNSTRIAAEPAADAPQKFDRNDERQEKKAEAASENTNPAVESAEARTEPKAVLKTESVRKKSKNPEEKAASDSKKTRVKNDGDADAAKKTAEKKADSASGDEKPEQKNTAKSAAKDGAKPVRKTAKAEVAAAEAYAEPEIDDEDGKETRPGTIEIYKDARGEFHFRFRAMNGSIVGHSQAYKSKDGCKNGIRSVIVNCEDAVVADTTRKDSGYVQTIGKSAFEIYKDSAEQFRYRLVAKNASNILASQGYTSKTNCIKGAESIVRMAKNHIVVDSTIRKPKDA